ncbi:Transcriptional regulator PadR-like family protein [uncultured archaeon]|nr:Transcriptional regulator PadR-like family protein [uncultured archaeon]
MVEEDCFLKQFDAILMRGILKIMIMGHLKRKGAYPYAMLKHFKGSIHPGLSKLKKSDMYNAIKSLESEGFIKYQMMTKGTRALKRYQLTPKGLKVMNASKKIGLKALADIRRLIESEFK